MSSPGSEAPLRLEVGPSPRLAAALLLTHGGALGLLLAAPLAGWLRLLLAATVLISLAAAVLRHLLPTRSGAVRELIWKPDGGWILVTGGGSRACRLRPGSYVHPLCTVLNFAGDTRRSVLLLPDNVDVEQFRRLRGRLGLEKTRY